MPDNVYLYPLYCVLHPFDGFERLKYEKKGSVLYSLIIVMLFFIANVSSTQYTGFPFNHNNPVKLNVLIIFARTAGLFIFWVLANWSLCTLMDGEGRFKEIWIASAYAILPMSLFSLIYSLITNFMVLEESFFLQATGLIFTIWSLAMMIVGLMTIHQYTLKKTLLSMLLTFVGVGIILFLLVLVMTLFQQVYVFIVSIYKEILFRS